MQLYKGTLLQGGKYRIEKVLGQGGFGITYLATQDILNRKVAIKEFFFKEFCEREDGTNTITLGTQSNKATVEKFLKKFIKEAQTISALHHPNIVQIHDIFRENNTAYYVMEYIDGKSLGDILKTQGALPETKAVEIINKVAVALDYIHTKNINHLDVKPNNIMVRHNDGEVILIDFGVAKQYDEETKEGTTTTPVGISHGYSPSEQYKRNGVSSFSPESDIYSLGATLYKMVTGITPPEAIEVAQEGLPEMPSHISDACKSVIRKSMMLNKADRPHNIAQFLDILNTKTQKFKSFYEEDIELTTPIVDENVEIKKVFQVKIHQPRRKTSPERKSHTKKYLGITAIICLVIAGFLLYKFCHNTSDITIPVKNGINIEMVKVEAGTFKMGATSEMDIGDSWEKPVHQVTLTKDYYIGKYEVTQALWKAVMGNNPSFFKGDNLPVESVSWDDCQEFISKLNRLTGRNFRLPTEAEWEYAARGGKKNRGYKYSGSNNDDDVAWNYHNSDQNTHSVGTKQSNELGIYDMSGNVMEWCQDWYGSYSCSPQTNPTGITSGTERVCRGGDFSSIPGSCRPSSRFSKIPNEHNVYTDNTFGLRLVLYAEEKENTKLSMPVVEKKIKVKRDSTSNLLSTPQKKAGIDSKKIRQDLPKPKETKEEKEHKYLIIDRKSRLDAIKKLTSDSIKDSAPKFGLG